MEQVILDHCSFGAIDPMYNISGNARNIIQADHLHFDEQTSGVRALWKGFPNFVWKNENELVSGSSGYYQKNGLFVFSVGDEKIIFFNDLNSITKDDVLKDVGIGSFSFFQYINIYLYYEEDDYYYKIDHGLLVFKEGRLGGRAKLWDEKGNIFADINFKNGKKDGLWKFYDSYGKIKIEGKHDMGIKKGSWIINF